MDVTWTVMLEKKHKTKLEAVDYLLTLLILKASRIINTAAITDRTHKLVTLESLVADIYLLGSSSTTVVPNFAFQQNIKRRELYRIFSLVRKTIKLAFVPVNK
jgi:hypothetical protein